MELLQAFWAWLMEGVSRFLPNLPTLPTLWRFLVEHVGNLPFVAAFLVMLYFALGLVTRAARSRDVRAFGVLILAVGTAGSVLLVGYLALIALPAPAAAVPPDTAHAAEIARRLGTEVRAPVVEPFADRFTAQLGKNYLFLLPCVTMMIVGMLITALFRKRVSQS